MNFIGKVATELGISRRTLRYDEAKGLLPNPSRSHSGYRIYDSRTAFRVRFIRNAQSLGLSLKEIQAVLEMYNNGKPPCRSFERLLHAHVRRIDTHIRRLRSLRNDLRNLLLSWADRCETDGKIVCPRLEHFAGAARKATRSLRGG